MSELTIDVPMDPPASLMPNRQQGRMHWTKRAAQTREYREIAKYAAMEAAQRSGPIRGPVAVTIHAAYGYRRQTPDLDATISASKAYLDGIVDAGVLVDDDQVQRITATHEKLRATRKERPLGFTRFVITEIEP